MHKAAPAIEAARSVPFVHIVVPPAPAPAPALTAGCARRFVTIVRGAQGGFGARLIGSGGDDAACAARIPAGGRDFSFVAGLKIPVRAGGGAGSVKLGGDRFPTLCALAAQCSIPSRSAIGYRCT
ncbi:hypothetical protein J6352_19595 [Burkholderia pseudomallei]|nr:hypothetical protein [Burkholderia pseudomallei]MBO7907591.1 hypothetical protein [Burkholderia pseudomallei]